MVVAEQIGREEDGRYLKAAEGTIGGVPTTLVIQSPGALCGMQPAGAKASPRP